MSVGPANAAPILPGLPPGLAGRPELAPLAYAIGRRDDAARDAYRQTLGRNLLLGRALDEVLGRLDAAGVPVQPLKGALHLETLYRGDAGARPMSDLDLLVPPGALAEAGAALTAAGFQRQGEAQARFGPRFTHHQLFLRGPVLVELHFRLCHELAVDGEAADFFRDTRPIVFRGRPRQVARDELQVYFTLLHAATHAYLHSAVWIVDAHLAARAAPGGLDWDLVARHAGRHRARRLVQAAARQVNVHFPGTFPAAAPRGLRDALLERLLHAGAAERVPYGPGGRSLAIRALSTDRLRDVPRLLGAKLELRLRELFERVDP